MARKGDRKPKPVAGDPTEPKGLGALARTYLDALEVRNYSPETINKYRLGLNDFIEWAEQRSLGTPVEITRPILERYQRHLFREPGKRGKPISFITQHHRLSCLRTWFKWLAQQRHVLHNPASEIELPKLGHRLPKHVLSQQEAEDVLNTTDVTDLFGFRDRAILETFYSTGIRRMELVRLQLYDVDYERGVLAIRQGKGRKDRVVPIGARALAWTAKYVSDVRPKLLVDENETTLYLTKFGLPFSGSGMSQLVSRYVTQGETGKTGACHLFRHSMATLMHEGGADIRDIQAMLGHVKLDTTQIYTQVSIRKLKKVHNKTHPAKSKPKTKRDPETQ